ncbi:DUF4167 domain-containing protein [Sphingopyxis sp.]|uniref:DUF4167 domain-containing protein n=1 Tax=Sphingopyxis sp. TaxID=1908224 RepID=UPI0025CC6F60|nr:DUF4167 domain-containing protein [Sphingopyxis sp.]
MNNRQSGRRRGRNNNSNNNNRSQSGGRGGVDQANRIDSRARGNGAQMIEKYRNLARDAQLAGDRVQTEYYLQFADHYFRVVSDFRARQEEKAAASGQERSHDRSREIRGVEDFDGHDDSGFENDVESERGEDRDNGGREGRERDRRDDDDNRGNRQQRDRGDRNDRSRRERDEDRAGKAKSDEAEVDAGEAEAAEEAAPAPARRRGPRRTRATESDNDSAGIDTAVLPPAIGRTERSADESGDAAEAAPAPKPRRTRKTLAPRDTGVEAAE